MAGNSKEHSSTGKEIYPRIGTGTPVAIRAATPESIFWPRLSIAIRAKHLKFGAVLTGTAVFEQVTVIAFDLDDTLWPCMPTIHRAEEMLYEWLEQHYPRVTERYNPTQMVEYRREFSAQEQRYAVDMTAMRYEFLQHLGDIHDYDGEQLSRNGFEVFFEARQQVEFYDDVLPCLQRLKQKFRLGSISNGNASIEHVGLAHLIEHSVSASDVMVAKPDRLIYEHLAERFDASPEEIVYVGDHPTYDVAGALAAGYHAVWINRESITWPDHLPEPDHQVTDLHQLEILLDE
jgi:putative hydrolase of the HAD superfamily